MHFFLFYYLLLIDIYFFFWLFGFCLNYLSWVSITGHLKKVLSAFLLLLYMLLLYMTFAIVTYDFSINARFFLGLISRSKIPRSGSMYISYFDSYILIASKKSCAWIVCELIFFTTFSKITIISFCFTFSI